MDADRRKTLQTLIALAETAHSSSEADCWDQCTETERLLRSQSNPQELRELGMSEAMIERVFGAATGQFTVRVEARFEAAHFLREYRGISEPLHGHSYKVEADLAGLTGGVDSDAIAVDFVSAKQKLETLAKLDYSCINDVPPFDAINPSAENIAQWFYRELAEAIAARTPSSTRSRSGKARSTPSPSAPVHEQASQPHSIERVGVSGAAMGRGEQVILIRKAESPIRGSASKHNSSSFPTNFHEGGSAGVDSHHAQRSRRRGSARSRVALRLESQVVFDRGTSKPISVSSRRST